MNSVIIDPKLRSMNRRRVPETAVLAIVTCLVAISSFAEDRSPGAAFLDKLLGSWNGRAVLTPVGALPYDLDFARTEGGAVAGTADPGAALHHWRFFMVNGQLRLRFLSTFRGNTRPTWLYAEQASPAGAFFRGRDLAHLTVKIKWEANQLRIDIFLQDSPHVSIRLSGGDGG
jgi:hypothetical protein